MSDPRDIILVVDDSEQNRYTVGRYLRKDGFEVWEADNGNKALEMATRLPSLIMLDIQLPDLSGFDVCRMIKNSPRTSSIPVLHTSATFTESTDKVQGLQGGADGYLVAPIDPKELVATVRALLKVRRAEAAAKALARQWQSTFDSISDGVCLLDAENCIERCNGSFAGLVRQTEPQRLVGQPILDLSPGGPLSSPDFHKAIEAGVAKVIEIGVENRWYRVSVSPVGEKDMPEAGLACVFSDITRLREAEETMHNINQELERRVKERTAALEDVNTQMESFCYSISHDLRAPLRAMQGFSDILIEEYAQKLDDEGRHFLDRIHKAAARMDVLIQDLLMYSRVSRADLEIVPIHLEELVQDILREHDTSTLERQPVFDVQLPADLTALGHPATFRQAVWNLIVNALKFVPPGATPHVRIFAEKVGNQIRLSIRDNGIGIAEEHRHRIFNIFERIHNEGYAGTGIGLAVVRRAMDRMDGAVGFDSKLGEGSTFWLELPAAPS